MPQFSATARPAENAGYNPRRMATSDKTTPAAHRTEKNDDLASLKIDRTRRRGASSVWPWIIVILIVLAAVWLGPQIRRQYFGVEVSVAQVSLISASTGNGAGSGAELNAAGYVVADRQSTLASLGTGLLAKLNVSEAQKVKKGEIIAEIDHHDMDAMKVQTEADRAEAGAEAERLASLVNQAEADMAAAKTPLETLDAQIRELKISLADAQRRYERDKKVAELNALPSYLIDDLHTEIHLDEAKIETAAKRKLETLEHLTVVTAQIATARAAVKVAQAHERAMAERVKVLDAQILDAIVLAPFDGVVTEKTAEVGEIVAPISIGGTMAKGSIVTLTDWTSLQAEVDVAEAYITRVRTGGRAAIMVDAFPDKVFPGQVRRILPRADRAKATVKVRVDFLKRDDTILPEMGIRVKFLPDDAPAGTETGALKPKLAIPRAALQWQTGTQFVWVVAENHASKRSVFPSVSVSDSSGDTVEIQTGLSAGELVVTRGAEKLTEDNQKVQVEAAKE